MKPISALLKLTLFCLVMTASGLWLPANAAVFTNPESPRCIDDMSARSVCFKGSRPRIISISPGVTELLFAAGASSNVIGVDNNSDYPTEADALPKVGGFPNISVEIIAAMKPDLVIWSTGNSGKVISQLQALGIPTFQLDVRDLSDMDKALRLLGQIAGTSQEANEAADRYTHRVSELQRQYGNEAPVSVFFEIWRSPLMTVGNAQLIDKVIALCGGENIYHDMDIPIAKIGVESLVARNPEVILGSDPRGHTPETVKAMNEYWQQWQNLQAVKKQQLFTVPSDLIARPAPRVLDGAEIICKQLQTVRVRKSGVEQPTLNASVTSPLADNQLF